MSKLFGGQGNRQIVAPQRAGRFGRQDPSSEAINCEKCTSFCCTLLLSQVALYNKDQTAPDAGSGNWLAATTGFAKLYKPLYVASNDKC